MGLKSVVASVARTGLGRFGYTVRHLSTVPTWDSFFDQISKHRIDIWTVFDIGVDQGTPELYDRFPAAALYLFDPTERAGRYMEGLARERLNTYAFNVALGERTGEMPLHSPAHAANGHGSSTFLEKPYDTDIGSRLVPVRRFDDLVGGFAKPALSKIDVQGFELKVLHGMTARLPDIDYFIIETGTLSPFNDADEFDALVRFMSDNGLVVYDILGLQRRPSDGALGGMDVAFVRRDGPLRRDKRWGTPTAAP